MKRIKQTVRPLILFLALICFLLTGCSLLSFVRSSASEPEKGDRDSGETVDSPSDADAVAGIYQSDAGEIYVFAADGTCRITDANKEVWIGAWYVAENVGNVLVWNFGEAERLQYTLHGDQMDLFSDLSSEHLAALHLTDPPPKTASLGDNSRTYLSGEYSRGEARGTGAQPYDDAAAYRFDPDGTVIISRNGADPYHADYEIDGNRLLITPTDGQGPSAEFFFEIDDHGLTLFPKASPDHGFCYGSASASTSIFGAISSLIPSLSSPSSAPSPSETPLPGNDSDTSAGGGGSENGDPVLITTDYYSIVIPGRIDGKYTVQQDTNRISLHEVKSQSDGTGGRFFELRLYEPDDLRFLDDPSIDALLGMLTTWDGKQFYLFLGKNTDVQWSSAGYDDFVLCTDCTEEIVASVTPLYGGTLTKAESMDPESKQIVFVDTSEYNGSYSALLTLAEWNGSGWTARLEGIAAHIGSNGTSENKREGDHCTPSGTFRILFSFSNQALDTGLRQKLLKDGDVWVTDQSSRYYNTIQSNSASSRDWSKSENIYRQLSSGRSVAGIFFDYNGDGESADSATPGAGAALFLDGIGKSGDLTTGYGDIKISGEDMLRLLKALDQTLNPTIIIQPAD